MEKMNELNRARGLLSQALGAALNSMPNNKSVQEARMHMKKALNELENAARTETRRKTMTDDQFKTWWGNIQAGTAAQAHTPMSAEANQKSLVQLNSMIDEEKKKLADLEKASEIPDPVVDILSD